MTVPLALDGNLILAGEVTNITVGADNPQGVITPTGELFIATDIAPRLFEGTITPVGTLEALQVGTGCFDTNYTECIEAEPVDLECIGACDEVVEPPPPDCPECEECEECPEPCEPCIECPECPPLIVNDCDEVLRILQTKVIAWHIVTCGLLGASAEDGIVVVEDWEYEDQGDAEANGWVFEDTLGDSNWQVGATDQFYSGERSLKAAMNGDGSLAGAAYLRATKSYGPGDGLVADSPYGVTTRGRMNVRSSFDVQKRLIVDGTLQVRKSLTSLSVGAWQLLTCNVTSTPGGIVTVRYECIHSFVRQVRQIWWDRLEISGPSSGIFQWNDMSGHENHLLAGASNRPQLLGTLLEGHNTMQFENAVMAWPPAMLQGIGSLEAFIVVKSTAGSGLWRLGADSADPTLFPESGTLKILENFASTVRLDHGVQVVDLTTGFRIYHIRALTEIESFIDNVAQFAQGYTQEFSSAPEFGRSGVGTPGDFEVAEIILTTQLIEQERLDTLAVLTRRWGLTV